MQYALYHALLLLPDNHQYKVMRRIFLITLITGVLTFAVTNCRSAVIRKDSPATIILDAASFLEEIPKDHYITDAATLKVPWLFNNTALVMGSRSNYILKVPVAETGTYYLFARSQGSKKSTFRIAVNDKVIAEDLGNGPLTFKKTGVFELKKGTADIRIMRIESSPVMDVMVLTKNPDFEEKDLIPYQLNEDVKLIREYKIPPLTSAVKFGDVNHDGKIDFMVLADDYSTHVYDHDGKELWNYTAPPDSEKDEAPGVIWDLDQDGFAEVVHWRFIDNKEWLVVADGRTGKIKNKVEWPTTAPLPHPFNNHRITIAKFKPGYPDNILVFTDIGGTISITNYSADLKQVWKHTENKKKDNLGHYVYPIDINQDGIDEVVAGSLVLDAKGKEMWNRFHIFYDNHDHVDAYSFADLDHDGKVELVAAHSEVGVAAFKPLTGKLIWENMAEHTQRIETGNFLKGIPGPQIAVTARTYGNRSAGEQYLWGQVQWFGPKGNLISKWPGNPVNGNPAFVKGDWKGNGKNELFWYKFGMDDAGKGKLYFGEPVYHMFDFAGGKAEEVITLQKDGGLLKVYGYKHADDNQLIKRDLEYLRNNIVNHTYY
jgi:hypothetical protein